MQRILAKKTEAESLHFSLATYENGSVHHKILGSSPVQQSRCTHLSVVLAPKSLAPCFGCFHLHQQCSCGGARS